MNKVATIGFFDGVHLGHNYLLEQLKTEAQQRGMQSMVVTFANHPRLFFDPNCGLKQLTLSDEKVRLLEEKGIDGYSVLLRVVVFLVAPSEVLNVEVRLYRGREYIQRLRVEVLALLRIVLSLQTVLKDLVRTNGNSISRICHFVNFRIRVVDIPVLVRIRAAHEYKELFILYRLIEDLAAISEPSSEKALLIVAGSSYTYEQLVCVCFHCLFEEVVLLWRFEGVYLIYDSEITVQ